MKITRNSNHKAVAPIIATLLMVAIAVVGGILIFVFTQGFFADEQVVGPTVDNIRIFGYSAENPASDGDGINHYAEDPLGTLGCSGSESDAGLQTGDCIALYVENLGDKPVAFQAVRIFGSTFTVSDDDADDDCGDSNGEFKLLVGESGTSEGILDPNEQASVCVRYDGSGGTVKAGRTIPVQIETSNGQSSQINIINGAIRGQLPGTPGD